MSGDQVRFGRFRLDLGRRELWRDETLIHLGSRVLDVLCVLVSAKGEVVTKDALMARVWSGLVVEEANIHVHVSALRKALDEGTRGQSHVVTVPGRGYRFVGLQPVPAADHGKSDAAQGLPLPDRPSIAVLPFVVRDGGERYAHLGDSLAEELIHLLSGAPGLRVIARTSAFRYRGDGHDP